MAQTPEQKAAVAEKRKAAAAAKKAEKADVGSVGVGAPTDPEMIDHVVTQEDLDNNPTLVAEGVNVGDTIQIPAPEAQSDEDNIAFRLRDGSIRVFSREVHGDDFAELAEQFSKKHGYKAI